MRKHRRFLLAPALARLFRREFPSTQITEGHFQRSDERHAHVILEDIYERYARLSEAGDPLES